MDAKQLLAKNEALSKWWSSVVGDGKFDQVMLILKASTFEGQPTPEQMGGITRFIELMSSITQAGEPPVKFASPGLHHDLDVPRRTVQPPETNQPEKPKKK